MTIEIKKIQFEIIFIDNYYFADNRINYDKNPHPYYFSIRWKCVLSDPTASPSSPAEQKLRFS